MNIATKRIYLRGLEYCKLMDVHLLENKVVQENQQTAFDKYTGTLPAYEVQKAMLRNSSFEIKNKPSKFKQIIQKVKENINKGKLGKMSESVRRAKKQRTKQGKRLTEAKRKLIKEVLRFQTSVPVKKFKNEDQY